MVGSKIIDRAMGMITKGELARATMTWKQAHLSAVMSGLLQLPHKGARGWDAAKEVTPSRASDPTTTKEFSLDDVQGHFHTIQRVIICPFGTVNTHGNTDV